LVYAVALLTALMLGFIAWSAVFRLRRDRVRTQRTLSRGKFAFRPKERARFLLERSFPIPEAKPHWEGPLVASLPGDASQAVPPVEPGMPAAPPRAP
jgi:hypothetical protein